MQRRMEKDKKQHTLFVLIPICDTLQDRFYSSHNKSNVFFWELFAKASHGFRAHQFFIQCLHLRDSAILQFCGSVNLRFCNVAMLFCCHYAILQLQFNAATSLRRNSASLVTTPQRHSAILQFHNSLESGFQFCSYVGVSACLCVCVFV